MRDLLLILFILSSLGITLRYPFVGILLWAWFTLATPQQAAYAAASLPLNTLIAGVTFIAFFLHQEYERVRLNPLMILLAVFGFWLWIAQTQSLDPGFSGEFYSRFIKIIIFIMLCMIMVTTRLRFHALLWLFAIVMGFYGAKGGVYTLLTFGQRIYFGLEDTVLYDNNHMGIALAVTLPLFLYLQGQAASLHLKRGIQVVLLLSIIAILGTHSRGAFVALGVFAGMILIRSWRNMIIGAAALAIIVPVGLNLLPDVWKDRMATIQNADEDASFLQRVDAWVINYELAQAHPLTGAGLRNSYQQAIANQVEPYRDARAAHSIYFEIMGGTGFVGLAIYLLLLGTAVLMAFLASRKYRHAETGKWRADFALNAVASLAIFGVAAASVSLEMWEGYLIIMALIGSLATVGGKVVAPAKAGRFAVQVAPERAYVLRPLAKGYQHRV
ncbi:putative O-glycosylation ligase, exosortase A system-associated [Parvularcula sp. IMCC14364]|uniref:putative O-glycosylation ligase, exosortase A system-associated n=1 Tax=Parvularcula sp. IMCC14364 TaxID=3067902 RepID=UPI002741336D|nr:putative O-glycosylation ligase, exosortase A system-associated [Parvularcula sp. IMCC14364]